MRTRRRTPFSALIRTTAYCPLIWRSTDLMPASSPSSRSSSSTLKPWRSAQRVYIRINISAQSCDSVPPAPPAGVGGCREPLEFAGDLRRFGVELPRQRLVGLRVGQLGEAAGIV